MSEEQRNTILEPHWSDADQAYRYCITATWDNMEEFNYESPDYECEQIPSFKDEIREERDFLIKVPVLIDDLLKRLQKEGIITDWARDQKLRLCVQMGKK